MTAGFPTSYGVTLIRTSRLAAPGSRAAGKRRGACAGPCIKARASSRNDITKALHQAFPQRKERGPINRPSLKALGFLQSIQATRALRARRANTPPSRTRPAQAEAGTGTAVGTVVKPLLPEGW